MRPFGLFFNLNRR